VKGISQADQSDFPVGVEQPIIVGNLSRFPQEYATRLIQPEMGIAGHDQILQLIGPRQPIGASGRK